MQLHEWCQFMIGSGRVVDPESIAAKKNPARSIALSESELKLLEETYMSNSSVCSVEFRVQQGLNESYQCQGKVHISK